ncbi:TRAF-like protein [Gracilaria domingensis]|nr:TRAF-like protein [Gracilaria domingensis]
MSPGTRSRQSRTSSYVCDTCGVRVLEKNRVLHNVVCQRNAAKARNKSVRRKPDTSYAHSIYKEYAQSQNVYAAGNHRAVSELEQQGDRGGVYRNVAYIEKLSKERAAELASPPSPTVPASPALSLAPFPLSPNMADFASYDMPRQILPASRRESSARHSEVFRDCQYCGREYTREHHMTHELQCAFTPFQCARCGQYVRRVDEQYHLQSGCLQGVMNSDTRGVSTVSRALTNHGRQVYTSDLRKMAGAAAFALATYVGSRLASRSGRGGGGPHIRYETVDGRGASNER